jgi:AraC-like DNA-binding protein
VSAKTKKPTTVFPQWRGYEIGPQGSLLDQVVDLDAEMGFAYERSCEFLKDFHAHDRLLLVFPRGASIMEVRTRNPSGRFRITARDWLSVPANLEHDDEGKSAIYDTFALFPTDALVSRACALFKVPPERAKALLRGPCQLHRRSPWLEQLLDRYFFERVIGRNAEAQALAFYEGQILGEVLKGTSKPPSPKPRSLSETTKSGGEESLAMRAVRYIETNLFDELDLEHLCAILGTSSSSLLRHFKKETGSTPYAYVKARRMEEALRLLQTGKHPVGDVALLVGYENFGAFSDAFKSVHGKPPSSFLAR